MAYCTPISSRLVKIVRGAEQKQNSTEVLNLCRLNNLHIPASTCVYVYTYPYTYVHISAVCTHIHILINGAMMHQHVLNHENRSLFDRKNKFGVIFVCHMWTDYILLACFDKMRGDVFITNGVSDLTPRNQMGVSQHLVSFPNEDSWGC